MVGRGVWRMEKEEGDREGREKERGRGRKREGKEEREKEKERGKKRSDVEPEGISSCDSLRHSHTGGAWNDNLALCKVTGRRGLHSDSHVTALAHK